MKTIRDLLRFLPVCITLYGQTLWAQCPPAGTTTYTVTNTNNSGVGSLRQAITCANLPASSITTIDFNFASGSAPFVISPSTVLPQITKSISLNG